MKSQATGSRGGSQQPAQRSKARRGRSSDGARPVMPASPHVAGSSSSSSSTTSQLGSEIDQRLTLQAQKPKVTPAPAPKPQTPASSKALEVKFAPRPGYGKSGARCVIRANHFLVELKDRDLHHYDVSISIRFMYLASAGSFFFWLLTNFAFPDSVIVLF